MLSIVCVFNNACKYDARLKKSLLRQTRSFQLIPVDNTDGRFSSATSALNWGARESVGDWVLFVHQDIEFLGEDWLNRAEELLAATDQAGWSGLVGRTDRGRWRGMIRDRAMVFGEPSDVPIEVQTLDEIVLMTRNRGIGATYFDEQLSGWHAYGVDACLTAISEGARNYVLPLPVWHDSASTNQAMLREAHAHVWSKHRRNFRRIYTTCGVLPHGYGYFGSYRVARLFSRFRDYCYLPWVRAAGSVKGFDQTPWEVLEQLTAFDPLVNCLHRHHPIGKIEANAFTDRTSNPRRIIHEFRGITQDDAQKAPVVVIAPELAPELTKGQSLPSASRLIVCIYLDAPYANLHLWKSILGRSFHCHLGMEQDETRWAILELAV